jgi:hypothetical protein
VINELRAVGGGNLCGKVSVCYFRYWNGVHTSMLLADVDRERLLLNGLQANDPVTFKLFNNELTETALFQIQGYSLGRAFASSISGDTVFSVLIGGCATVINGHFPMHTGQLVQWYFGCEKENLHLTTDYTHNVGGSNIALLVGGRKQQVALGGAGVILTSAMKKR